MPAATACRLMDAARPPPAEIAHHRQLRPAVAADQLAVEVENEGGGGGAVMLGRQRVEWDRERDAEALHHLRDEVPVEAEDAFHIGTAVEVDHLTGRGGAPRGARCDGVDLAAVVEARRDIEPPPHPRRWRHRADAMVLDVVRQGALTDVSPADAGDPDPKGRGLGSETCHRLWSPSRDAVA